MGIAHLEPQEVNRFLAVVGYPNYPLELVEGLTTGIQCFKNSVRDKTDDTVLISRMLHQRGFTYRMSHGKPMNSGNDTIPVWNRLNHAGEKS